MPSTNSTTPMPRSKRLRLNVGQRTYEQLLHLADLADQSVATEARLLLTWGIDMALRRWEDLTGQGPDDPAPEPLPSPWAQPVLPMFDPTPAEVERALAEVRQNPRTIEVSTDEDEPPRPFPPID